MAQKSESTPDTGENNQGQALIHGGDDNHARSNVQSEEDAPLSVVASQRGIKTSADFADFMGALMADLVSGKVRPDAAVAACKAADKLLQVVRLQLDYGSKREALYLSGERIAKNRE